MKKLGFWLGLWALGNKLEKNSISNKNKLFKEYEYSSPFKLPSLNHPYFGNTFIWNKSIINNNEEAEYEAEKICDEINAIENIELIPVYAKKGTNILKIKVKPMNYIKKSFNLERQIKYITKSEETRIYPEGDKIVLEIPRKGTIVRFGDFMHDMEYRIKKSKTIIPIGRNTDGENVYGDIEKMPHMLVAGATGSGKSVFLNGMIISLLMRNTPYDMKMILIDPKMVEFNSYKNLHYVKYITEINKAIETLSELCNEMDKRYQKMADKGCRDIKTYNDNFPEYRMPRILLVIDEMADMIMNKTYGKQVEKNIIRLAQKARASGIHMVLSTQRPSKEVVTGLIKANIPTRVCLSVMSKTDSMVVLDKIGGEKLNGNGDLLYLDGSTCIEPIRLQAGLITTEEIENVVFPLVLDNQPDSLKNIDWKTKPEDARKYYGIK